MKTSMMLLALFVAALLLVLVGAAPAVAVADRDDEAKKCKPFDKPGKDEKKRCPPTSSGGAARADYNGDGFSDLAIGAPSEDVGSVQNAGAVIVAYGSADGITTSGSRLLHRGLSPIPGPPVAGERFGSSLAGGDFNLDGYADLAVTTFAPDRLYVLYGSFSGIGASAPQVWAARDLNLFEDRNAWSLVWGNFGLGPEADLAIGNADSSDAPWGRVVVLYGSTSGGLGAKGRQTLDQNDLAPGASSGAGRFGAVLAAGSLGGTSEHELVVGAPNARAVFAFYGSPNGMDTPAVGRAPGTPSSRRYGWSLAIGDFDGDGDGYLGVGDPEYTESFTSQGAVFVYEHTSSGLDWAPSVKTDESAGALEYFGYALAAGDFDGDGERDLAIGAPGQNLSAAQNDGTAVEDAGAVTVLFGSTDGLTWARKQFLLQGHGGLFGTAEEDDNFGGELSAWNWGRGGATDLAVGVPWEDVGTQPDSGVVQVLYGAAGGVGFGGQQLFDQSQFGLSVEAGDWFGYSLY